MLLTILFLYLLAGCFCLLLMRGLNPQSWAKMLDGVELSCPATPRAILDLLGVGFVLVAWPLVIWHVIFS